MRIARSTGAVSGSLIALLGVWVALIPFVGPYFDYSFGTNATWHFTTDRLWLDILPGVLAVLAGALLLVTGHRLAGIFGGWLAIVAGAWLVVGPSVSLTWERGRGPIGRPLFGSTRQMLELIGYFYGAGVLIAGLGAFAIGRFASRPRLTEEPAVTETIVAEAVARPAAHDTPTPATVERSRRSRLRFGPRRRRGARATRRSERDATTNTPG
jgi:hypothetical protein